jgi:hypothetical protein
VKRMLASAVATLFALVLIPLNAAASAPNAPQIPSWKAVTPEFLARIAAKQTLALELFATYTGHGSMSKFREDLSLFVTKWGTSTFASTVGTTANTVMPTSLTLPLNQYAELAPAQYCKDGAVTCYCGPSTAESILEYLQPTSHFGEVLYSSSQGWGYGQYGLAGLFGPGAPYSLNYLETNAPHGSIPGGETPYFSSKTDWPMSQSFNYWISGNVNGSPYYTEDPAPYSGHQVTLTEYKSDLTADIWNLGDSGFPLAADVEEIPNHTNPLFGHPTNIEIQHWIPLYGYSNSGYYTDYIDPIYGTTLNGQIGFNVSAKNTGYPSSWLFTLFTDAGPHGGPFGFVW